MSQAGCIRDIFIFMRMIIRRKEYTGQASIRGESTRGVLKQFRLRLFVKKNSCSLFFSIEINAGCRWRENKQIIESNVIDNVYFGGFVK